MRTLAALLLVLSAVPARAGERILGFNFPLWSADGYASPVAERGLREIADTGAGWVALTPTLYVRDRRDSTVAAGPDTPTDGSLRAAIHAAKAKGLKVALKPHVDERSGGVRAWIEPRDADAWFASYRVHLLRYARLAREEGCGLFVVGTELSFLTAPNHWKAWRALIRDVRAEFPGPLTYAANWHSAAHVGFWRDLDYIGVDAYYPVAGGEHGRLLRLSWKPYEAELRALSLAHGRPVLFTEFGAASQRGAALKPWEWRDYADADPEAQSAYLRSLLATFAGKKWVAGFLHWAWDMDPAHQGLSDKSMSVRGKPALDVLRNLFAGGPPGAAAPPPPSPSHAPAAARAAAVLADAAALDAQ